MQFYIAILKKDVIKRLTDSASGLSQLIQSITGFFYSHDRLKAYLGEPFSG